MGQFLGAVVILSRLGPSYPQRRIETPAGSRPLFYGSIRDNGLVASPALACVQPADAALRHGHPDPHGPVRPVTVYLSRRAVHDRAWGKRRRILDQRS